MAVQAILNSRQGKTTEVFSIRQQLKDEAEKLLSFQTLGTRMSQLDNIIKRRADKVFFSMETDSADKARNGKMSEDSKRREKIVLELLKKVKKRRKMIRSYTYLSWFCIFFCCFLGSLYLKEDNFHLYSVDNSIRNRVVDILPSQGTIPSNTLFYDWLGGVVTEMFPATICGNGICEYPDEYPGFGRFGCVSDCGRYLQTTPIRIDVISAWKSKPGGLDLPGFIIGAGDNANVNFSFNIYSDTMQDYLFAEDVTQYSALVDVPDGNLWLELYQTESLFHDTPTRDIIDYAQISQTSGLNPSKSFDYQYGVPAEAIATVAQINRQLHQYCTIDNDGSAQFATCPAVYDPQQFAAILRNRYGLAGNISVSQGTARKTVVSFPFCTLTPPMNKPDPALVDPAFCVDDLWNGSATLPSACFSGGVLAKRFACNGRYPFSIWSYGPPRNVTVLPPLAKFRARTLTPFNNVIGSIILSQYRRKDTNCSSRNQDAIKVLTGQYTCQAPDRGVNPFGIDPVFQKTSTLYNGKLTISDFYADNERISTGSLGGTNSTVLSYPFAFFPHQWGKGGLKPSMYVVPSQIGVYKLFFDTRLTAQQSQLLVQFMRDGMFVSDKTEMIELEIITYNPDFNFFGILTIQFTWDLGGGILWNAQYNTAQLSPYAGVKGQVTLALEVIFGAMLVIDIVRESRDIYLAILREDLIVGYMMKVWNWIDWSHYGLLGSSLYLWTAYNQYISSLNLKSSYPVLSDLGAKARVFAPDAKGEYDMLDFTEKMRKLAEMKNSYTALNCLSILFFVIRILKILDFQPRMSLITRTLRVASIDLGHYLLLFALIFVGYASVGTLLLGDRLQQFQTFGDSCCELFMIFMGWEPMYQIMGQAAGQTKVLASSVIFQIFYWSWVLVATFLMLNILLAIIVDAYASVKAKMQDAPTIVHESWIVCKESGQMIGNRICGSEWFISDKELERVLVKQNRNFQSKKNILDTIGQLRGKIKSVRLAGGLEVSEKDFANLLQGSGTTGRSLLAKAQISGRDDSVVKNVKMEDGVEVEDELEWKPPPAVENLIKRYGEVVPDGKDDEELLDLIRTENMKRQMAMYTTQDHIRQQVEVVSDMLNAIVRCVLPPEERERLQTAMLLKQNADGCISLDVGDILSNTTKIDGTLKVTVVSAKRLPKLDVFTESDPYCVLVLEGPSETGEAAIEPVGRTDTKKNDANPIWNAEFSFPLQCDNGTKLSVVLLDKDEHGGDDLIGSVPIIVSALPLGKEVDKWYKLRNDSAPHLTKRAMLRIKVRFSADNHTSLECNGGGHKEKRSSEAKAERLSQTGSDFQKELLWLNEKLSTVIPATSGAVSQKMGSRTLEVTLVCARHLPRRDVFFMKVDPYVKIAFNGVEYESLIRKRTYSPDWNQSFLFHIKEASEVSGSLQVVVMDWDRLSKHDLIGFAEIKEEIMSDMMSQEENWTQEHILIIQNKGKPVIGNDGSRSEITLKFKLIYDELPIYSQHENHSQSDECLQDVIASFQGNQSLSKSPSPPPNGFVQRALGRSQSASPTGFDLKAAPVKDVPEISMLQNDLRFHPRNVSAASLEPNVLHGDHSARTNVEKHTNINQASSDDDGQMFDAHEEIDDIDVEIEVRPHDMKPRLDLSDGSFK